ncbi:restriction endonuclease subunit S [Niveibacterium sp. SC-1]|uniref:restriction endonuclease subunit S n=1 Tax=Niveibacterium sp. SC-1 TaxID=3135646 RepID=UPI00311EC483
MSTKQARLGDVVSFIRGITFKPEDVCEPGTNNSVVCMRTKNIQSDLDESDLIAVDAAFVKREEQRLATGDILLSSANSWNLVGKSVYVPPLPYAATAGGFISIVRADQSKVDARYLYHWISTEKTQAAIRNCGRQTTNISNLSSRLFLELPLPLPSVTEQKRIAAILDKADSLRRKRRQAIRLADDFLRAVFLDMFGDPVANPKGWPVVKLSDLAKKDRYAIKAGPFGSALKKEFYVASGYRVYGQEQVIRDDLTYGDYYIDANKYRELESCKVEAGDMLISLVGTFGKICIVPKEFEPGIINPRLMKIGLDSRKATPRFMKAFLTSDSMMRTIEGLSHGGTMGIVNVGIMKNLDVPLPPLDLQLRYENVQKKISVLSCKLDASVAQTSSAFGALQARFFS